MYRVIVLIVVSLITHFATAVPSQVIVIRHADKWQESPGNILSPTGYLRAVKFSEYYMEKFKEAPDFLFASNPTSKESSMRPIQTLTPLAGHKELIQKKVFINHDFTKGDEKKLVEHILNDPQYDKKNILICWQHGVIREKMLHYFGVKEKITWLEQDYDTVYILTFKDGNLAKTTRLDNQYPVPQINDWSYFLKN